MPLTLAPTPRDALIVGYVRTPFGRYGGALATVRPDDLAALAVATVVERAGIDPALIDDVYLGAANQAGEDNRNVARMAALLAGFPETVPGITVNRLCGSGLQAVVAAARDIQTGGADVVVAGGAESMTRAPYVMEKSAAAYQRGAPQVHDTTLGWRMENPRLMERYDPTPLGVTAEMVAERYGVSRDAQDAFALRSHKRAVRAQDEGVFRDEIVPVLVRGRRGTVSEVSRDEGPRSDTSLQALAGLRPAFRTGGTVTAGNSSGLNDGAAALLLMSRERTVELGLRPLARFVDAAVAGVHPDYMGIGPVPATRKLLARHGLAVEDLDVTEINEAFAAQVLASLRLLGMKEEMVNAHGGAIALGHPLGASGARLAGRVALDLDKRGHGLGLATMCVGVGQGISALLAAEGAR